MQMTIVGLTAATPSTLPPEVNAVADGVLVNGRALLLAQDPAQPVTLLLQTTAGNFTRTDIAVADGARRLIVADLNDDGVPDLAVVSMVYQAIGEASRVTVLLQSSTTRAKFGAGTLYIGAPVASFIAAGDLNGDGLNDIVLDDGPSVLRQQAASPGLFDPVQPLR